MENEQELIHQDAPAEVVPAKATDASAKAPTATMRHPHTGDTVEATQAELIPLMYRGYEQVKKA